MAAELKIGIGAESTLQNDLKAAEAQISNFVNKVKGIGQIGEQMQSLGQKLTIGITAPIVGLAAASIKAYGDIESLKKGLEAVSGSAADANKEFIKLKEVSKLPGLGMEEAVKGSINLQSIGLSADKARNILSQFGNAVATVGKGKVEFERAIYGVQQLANTDFPLGEDLNIIKDALPQVAKLLDDAFGTANTEKIRESGVTSKQVLDVILAGLEKLPRVSGGIKGAFENLGDAMKVNLGRIGDIINKNFDISGIIDKITNFVDKAVTAFENLNPAIQKGILVVGGLVAAAGPLLTVFGGLMAALPSIVEGFGILSLGITKVGGLMGLLTNPITLVTAGLIGIVTAVVSNWDKIKPYLEGTIKYFVDLYNESTVFRVAVQGIGFAFEGLWSIVKNVLSGIWNSFKSFGRGILELFAGIGSVIKGALTLDWGEIKAGYQRGFAAIGSTISGTFSQIKNTASNIFSDLDSLEKKWSSRRTVSVSNFFPSSNEVSSEVENDFTKGIASGVAKVNSTAPKIEIPIAIKTGDFAGLDFTEANKNLNAPIFSEEQISGIEQNMKSGFARIQSVYFGLSESVAEMNKNFHILLANMIPEALSEGITNTFGAIGEAMANGGNILAAAGGAILGTLGQFLSMLGKEMVKLGVGAIGLGKLVQAIQKLLIKNPAAVIAIGAAAIAAGALLSATASNIGGGSSSGGGSFSSSTGGGGFSSGTTGGNYSTSSNSFSGNVVFRIAGQDLVGVLSRNLDKNIRLNAN